MNPPDDGIELPPPPIIISTGELDDSRPTLELLVVRLDSSAPGSAPVDLERRIAHLREVPGLTNPDASRIPPYIKSIQVGDKAIDYCKVRGGNVKEMGVTKKLLAAQGLDVIWSPCSGPDKSRTIQVGLRALGNEAKDERKLRATMEKALLEQFEATIAEWFLSPPREEYDEPRVHITLVDRSKAIAVAQAKVKVGHHLLSVKGPKVLIPAHPYQLAVYSTRLPDKESLDGYTSKFGLRSSEMPHSSLYTFVVTDWAATSHVLASWNPQSIGAPELPKPQLVYYYNSGGSWSSKNNSSYQFKKLEMQYDQISTIGTDIARSNANMRAEFKEELAQAGDRMMDRMDKAMAHERQNSQEFQRYLVDSLKQIVESNTQNLAAIASEMYQANCNTASAILLQNDISERLTEREILRREAATRPGKNTHIADRITQLGREIDEAKGLQKELLTSNQAQRFQPTTVPSSNRKRGIEEADEANKRSKATGGSSAQRDVLDPMLVDNVSGTILTTPSTITGLTHIAFPDAVDTIPDGVTPTMNLDTPSSWFSFSVFHSPFQFLLQPVFSFYAIPAILSFSPLASQSLSSSLPPFFFSVPRLQRFLNSIMRWLSWISVFFLLCIPITSVSFSFQAIVCWNLKLILMPPRPTGPRSLRPKSGPQFYTLLSLLALLCFAPVALVDASHTPHSRSIWTLNVAGGHSALKLNTIHSNIMQGQPDIFVLTDTRSDGATIRAKDWRDYQIRESMGRTRTSGPFRDAGVLVGVKTHLPIVEDHVEVTGLEGWLVQVSVKLAIRGKGVKFKIFGVYAPPVGSRNACGEQLFNWIATHKEDHWMAIGDLNLTTEFCESMTMNSHAARLPWLRAYKQLLAQYPAPGYDWWETRDRTTMNDYTRRAWNAGAVNNEDVEGTEKSIIDRIASSNLFEHPEIYNRPDLFVAGTDHVWVNASAQIQHWNRHTTDREVLRQWIERRPKLPKKSEKSEKIATYQEAVKAMLKEKQATAGCINSDLQFDEMYKLMSEIIISKSYEAFGRRHMKDLQSKISTPEIRRKVHEIRRFGRLIYAARTDHVYQLMFENPRWAPGLVAKATQHANLNGSTLAEAARALAKPVRRELFQMNKRAAEDARLKSRHRETLEVLSGQSSKSLAGRRTEHITTTIITKPRVPPSTVETTVAAPEEVRKAYEEYFTNLFKKQNVHGELGHAEKPWLRSGVTGIFQERSAQLKPQWPPQIDSNSLLRILKKGNPFPSPGPDLWEKWCVRHLPEEALAIITELVRYILDKNYFPSYLKETTLLTIHKKGDITKLANYRGIMLTNTLMTIAISFEATMLQEWADRLDLLPNLQAATRPGAQGRDVTNFLSMVEAWSNRNNESVYILKKDQKKGFDFLSLQCFYDCVDFYGLPSQIKDFDKATQHDVSCRIMTAYGLTDPIQLSGVNRQGDNRAPIRFTLSTGMGSWYIHEQALSTELLSDRIPASITMTTLNAKNNMPHTPADDVKVHLTTVEMMDDSLIFGRSLEVIKKLNEIQEIFQFTYGAVTATGPDKTAVTIMKPNGVNSDRVLTFRRVKSIQLNASGGWETVWEDMELPVLDRLTFLKTLINDQQSTYNELKMVIGNFALPTIPKRLPVTAVRRIIAQLLIPKISQRLRLQPVSRNQAKLLDNQLSDFINKYYKWTSRIPSDVLHLAIENHGFEFPSIADINASVTIKGLVRDLNHKIRNIRQLAHITLQDWTCQDNKCQSPLIAGNPSNKNYVTTDCPTRVKGRYPDAWLTATAYMRDLGLSVINTDQAYLMDGRASQEHIDNLRKNNPQSLSFQTVDDTAWIVLDLQLPIHRSTEPTPIAKMRFIRWMDEERRTLVDPDDIQERQRQASDHLAYFRSIGKMVVGEPGMRGIVAHSTQAELQFWMVTRPENQPDMPTENRRHRSARLTARVTLMKTSQFTRNGDSIWIRGNTWECLSGYSTADDDSSFDNPDQLITATNTMPDLGWKSRRGRCGENIGLVEGDWQLGLSRKERRGWAEEIIENWSLLNLQEMNTEAERFGTDGSMMPANVRPGERRLVTAACVTGGNTLGALVTGRETVVMQGELFGIIMALIRARMGEKKSIIIYSDYLNGIRKIQQMRDTGVSSISSGGRSWYRWIFRLWSDLEHNGISITINHVKSHTGEETEEAILNDRADKACQEAREGCQNHAPWPTFEMDEFMPWTEDGYIEQDLYKWTKTRRIQQRASTVATKYIRLNMSHFENAAKTNTAYYTKSPYDYAIKVQMLTRGNALPTNLRIERIFPDTGHWGPFCPDCGEVESEHHIFVNCNAYDQDRRKCISEFQQRVDKWFSKMEESIPEALTERINTTVKNIFSDSGLWPGNRSSYYLGLVPRFEPLPPSINRTKLIKLFHVEMIRSAGYIWSRRMTKRYHHIAKILQEHELVITAHRTGSGRERF